ncbi:hypothetical protein [Kitasatospora sp. GAS204B]|uniref:hypothetical protein n=1 Tax=unclassified Kitasatospora TaxID=2633591 RepID=UPI00247340AB|nr:hypothetical protein [Kitasatospora sp. GAS204B]MDH6120733.1 hypothetical protein [Kitasatospora sp. GAS204B]
MSAFVRLLDQLLVLLGTAGAAQFAVPLPVEEEYCCRDCGLALDRQDGRGGDWDDWEIELLGRRSERLGPPLEWLP